MLYLSLSKNQTDKLGHIQSARNYLKKIPMKKPRVRRESSINKIFNHTPSPTKDHMSSECNKKLNVLSSIPKLPRIQFLPPQESSNNQIRIESSESKPNYINFPYLRKYQERFCRGSIIPYISEKSEYQEDEIIKENNLKILEDVIIPPLSIKPKESPKQKVSLSNFKKEKTQVIKLENKYFNTDNIVLTGWDKEISFDSHH